MKLEDYRAGIAACIKGTCFEGKTYFAGGCVRDSVRSELPGATHSDIDITVEMEQGGILLAEYLLPRLQGMAITSHAEYGTAKLSLPDGCIEFVATRKERYHRNSRYPAIAPSTLRDDVLRRDFTINALLMEVVTGELLDLTGMGISDLTSGIIRCVGEPRQKFREDPLRLLRALRFALRFGFVIQPVTYATMQTEAMGINRLSPACIRLELQKIALHTPRQALQHAVNKLGWNNTKLAKLLSLY